MGKSSSFGGWIMLERRLLKKQKGRGNSDRSFLAFLEFYILVLSFEIPRSKILLLVDCVRGLFFSFLFFFWKLLY